MGFLSLLLQQVVRRECWERSSASWPDDLEFGSWIWPLWQRRGVGTLRVPPRLDARDAPVGVHGDAPVGVPGDALVGVTRGVLVQDPKGCSTSGQGMEKMPPYPPGLEPGAGCGPRSSSPGCGVKQRSEACGEGTPGDTFGGAQEGSSQHSDAPHPMVGQGGGSWTVTASLLFPFIPCLRLFPFSLKRGFLSYFGLAFQLLAFIISI